MMDCYRNTGGFDMLGSGRDKIDKVRDARADISGYVPEGCAHTLMLEPGCFC